MDECYRKKHPITPYQITNSLHRALSILAFHVGHPLNIGQILQSTCAKEGKKIHMSSFATL